MSDGTLPLAWDPTAPLPTGHFALEASAGTGKTYAVTGLVARWLMGTPTTAPLDPTALVVTTFTRAAALELQIRTRERLEELASPDMPDDALGRHLRDTLGDEDCRARAAAAADTLERATISTLHGFASRALDIAGDDTFDVGAGVAEAIGADLAAAFDTSIYDLAAQLPSGTSGFLQLPNAQTLRTWTHLRLQYPDAVWSPSLTPLADIQHRIHRASALWTEHSDAILAARAEMGAVPVTKAGKPTTAKQVDKLLGFGEEIADGSYSGSRKKVMALAGDLLANGSFNASVSAWLEAIADLSDIWATWPVMLKAHLADAAVTHVRKRLGRRGERTHADIIHQLHSLVTGPDRTQALSRLRGQWTVAIVDEFQDTDAVQWDILSQIFADRPLVVVGDPKQSIYRFRGADVDAYTEARRAAATHATMAQNWRSTNNVVDGVVALFTGYDDPFARTDITMPVVTAARNVHETLTLDNPAVELRTITDTSIALADAHDLVPTAEPDDMTTDDWTRLLARDVAHDIAETLQQNHTVTDDKRPLRRGDCCVLVGTHREAQAVRDALATLGLPATHVDKRSVFTTTAASELILLAEAVLHPSSRREALATSIVGLSAPALLTTRDRELAHAEALFEPQRPFAAPATQLRDILRSLHRHPLIAQRPNPETEAHIDQLLEILSDTPEVAMQNVPTWASVHMQQALERAEDTPRAHRIRPAAATDAVEVMTVHGAKGLEFEATWIPFLWRDRRLTPPAFMHTPAHPTLVASAAAPEYSAIKDEAASEARRLAYVALTRGRSRVVVHVPTTFGAATSKKQVGPLYGVLFNATMRNQLPDSSDATVAALQTAFADVAAVGVTTLAWRDAKPLPTPEVPLAAKPLQTIPVRLPARRWSFTAMKRTVEPDHDHSMPAAVAGHADDAGLLDGGIDGGIDSDNVDINDYEQALSEQAHDDPWSRLAGGAALGTAVHDMLDGLDMRDDDAITERAQAAARRLSGLRGLSDTEQHTMAVDLHAAVTTALATPWAADGADGPPAITLADIDPTDRLDEISFDMRLRTGSVIKSADVTVADIGRVLADSQGWPDPRPTQHVGRQLMAAGAHTPLAGMLTGAIDLTVRTTTDAGPVWWVVDYKTNDLRGGTCGDVIGHSLYALQYHLYTVALHRHLSGRLAGYDPDRHLGGSIYLFLREMNGTAGSGVWFERIPTATVRALDAVLGGNA